MTMGMLKKVSLRTVIQKAKELYGNGASVEDIVKKFWAEPKIVAGFDAIGVTPEELTQMINKEINKKVGK